MKALFTVVLAILCFDIQRLQATTEEEDKEIEGHNYSSSNDDYQQNVPRVEPTAWPQAKVYYEISGDFEPKDRQQILMMMQKIENVSCVRFVAVTTQTIYMEIRYRPTKHCGSFVGYRHDIPKIMDLQRDCLTEYGILHELMHALGFRHEHMREDRDKYVTVNRANIPPKDFKKNFAKREHLEFIYYNMSYDYNSVTHYKPYDFAIDPSLPTIVAKNGQQIEANGLSMNDVRKINIYYKCYDIEGRTTLPFTVAQTTAQVLQPTTTVSEVLKHKDRKVKQKTRWPELVGTTGQEAVNIIKRKTGFTKVLTISPLFMVTHDYRLDRVFVDEYGNVAD